MCWCFCFAAHWHMFSIRSPFICWTPNSNNIHCISNAFQLPRNPGNKAQYSFSISFSSLKRIAIAYTDSTRKKKQISRLIVILGTAPTKHPSLETIAVHIHNFSLWSLIKQHGYRFYILSFNRHWYGFLFMQTFVSFSLFANVFAKACACVYHQWTSVL